MILRNWYYRQGFLSGVVENHPRFANGTTVFTSTPQRVLKESEDAVIVETRNTFYLLDPPGPFEIEESA